MKAYHEIVDGYRKRRREGLTDALLSAIAVWSIMVTHAPAWLAAGAIVVAQEGWRAIRQLKPVRNAWMDALLRLIWTALAIAAGCSAGMRVSLRAGMLAAMSARLLMARCRPLALTGCRVYGRILRLRELNVQLRQGKIAHPEQKESRESRAYSFTDGEKSAIMKRDSS